ncbi:MAG: GNAT family N-acetyltransferase [Ruminococcaceae bacterium]|nr:GNAT family N-acetyltransferase [Oscillospiraceae bacterium]
MILLRNLKKEDASELQEYVYSDLSTEQVEALICDWDKKQFNGKYFEMYAIVSDEKVVGTISLYQHSSEVISIGPEIFCEYRRKGFAKEAMICACQMAKEKGFKIVSQQIRTNNAASIALHCSLGFETNELVFTNAKGNQVYIYLKCLT